MFRRDDSLHIRECLVLNSIALFSRSFDVLFLFIVLRFNPLISKQFMNCREAISSLILVLLDVMIFLERLNQMSRQRSIVSLQQIFCFLRTTLLCLSMLMLIDKTRHLNVKRSPRKFFQVRLRNQLVVLDYRWNDANLGIVLIFHAFFLRSEITKWALFNIGEG